MSDGRKKHFRRVLVIDDDALLLDSLAALLSRVGYESATATSGSQALELAESEEFDAILCDISMPDFSGLEFLRRLRKTDADVPVILMTGVASLESAIEAVQFGAYRYLEKPIEPTTLAESLGQAVTVHDLAKLRREAVALSGLQNLQLDANAALESCFDQALAGLRMLLQPIVSVGGSGIVAYEALLRSTEPTLPKPRDLLDAARRLGRSHQLGRRSRALAAQIVGHLPPGRLLFVNVSVDELHDNELYSASAPLSSVAQRIVLEISEREPLGEVLGLTARLNKLRSLGFRIAMDGVGTGYAGLSAFGTLEPDYAKLDGQLIRGLDISDRRRSLISGLTRTLGRDLSVTVIATCVQTDEECSALSEAGVLMMQGNLFGPPFDASVLQDEGTTAPRPKPLN